MENRGTPENEVRKRVLCKPLRTHLDTNQAKGWQLGGSPQKAHHALPCQAQDRSPMGMVG